jgi:metal-dependent amidase/aminoacylase/carboxypeptidase family protein
MGAEDFAYFAQRVPGLLIRLGVRNESVGATHPVHSPLFRLDEAALPIGVASLLLFARGIGTGEIG